MGYLFILVPNVEMITATIFIAGLVLGPFHGAIVGLLAELIYSSSNAYGAAMPPLLLAQIISFALVGWVGGLVGRREIHPLSLRVFVFGVCGLLLTLFYDVLTTLSFALFNFGFDLKKIVSSFLVGVSFYAVHIFVNTIIFVVVVPVVQSALHRYLK